MHPFSGQPDSMFKDYSLRREDDLAATTDDLLQMGMKMAKPWLMYRLDLASKLSQVLILLQLWIDGLVMAMTMTLVL